MSDRSHHIQEIHAERQRQIEVEGWTPEHDDEHDDAEMLRAAVLYYHHATRPADWPLRMRSDGAPVGWPWDKKWWKPKEPRRRNLIVAGALCLAERERIIRRHEKLTKGYSYFGAKNPEPPHIGHVEQKLQIVLDALAHVDGAGGD